MYTFSDLYYWRFIFVAAMLGILAIAWLLGILAQSLHRRWTASGPRTIPNVGLPVGPDALDLDPTARAEVGSTDVVHRVFPDGSRMIHVH